jgi:hypothetical protein
VTWPTGMSYRCFLSVRRRCLRCQPFLTGTLSAARSQRAQSDSSYNALHERQAKVVGHCPMLHKPQPQLPLMPLCSRRSRYVLRPVAECPDGKMRPTWPRRARREPQSAWVCELPWSVCWWSESRRKQLASQEFGWRTLSGSSSSRAGSLSPAAVTQVIGGQFRNHGCTSRPAPACPPRAGPQLKSRRDGVTK